MAVGLAPAMAVLPMPPTLATLKPPGPAAMAALSGPTAEARSLVSVDVLTLPGGPPGQAPRANVSLGPL